MDLIELLPFVRSRRFFKVYHLMNKTDNSL